MTNTLIKKGQKVQIRVKIGRKKHIIDTYIIEPEPDRLNLSFPESQNDVAPFLFEGVEIKAFIYTYTGIIIIDSIVYDSPYKGQFVIEYNNNQQIIQRRKYIRVPCKDDLFIQDEDGNIKTQAIDISGGGIRFNSDTPLTINNIYQVQLRLNYCKQMIKAEGLIHKKKFYHPNEYVLEFTNIDEKDRDKIIQKCKESQKKQRKTSF